MIKYIKMSNGELVIGNVIERGEYNLTIENPMIVIIDRMRNDGGYYIGEYIPMTKVAMMPLFYKDIICVIDPDQVLLDQYRDMFNQKSGENKKSVNPKFH